MSTYDRVPMDVYRPQWDRTNLAVNRLIAKTERLSSRYSPVRMAAQAEIAKRVLHNCAMLWAGPRLACRLPQ